MMDTPVTVGDDLEGCKRSIQETLTKVDKLEKQVIEVEQFYKSGGNAQVNNSKGSSIVKEKGREKSQAATRKPLQDAPRMETAATKRMQELMRQFSTILRQITQHKWAWPFLDPVDYKGLGLDDYLKIIDKPMDFGTIKSKMEAKDGTGYKNVREIYADVRLIFKNAMKYNDEKHDVHVMAKTLLEKFEDKWLQLLPKVAEEEKRQVEEEAQSQLEVQHTREMTYANMAKDLGSELSKVDMHLKKLREMVVQKCRKLSAHEKKLVGIALTKLSPDNLSKALEIVAENNPNFQSNNEEVDLDIDAQSDYTLWKLKFFVRDALEVQQKNTGGVAVKDDADKRNNSKRKREICDSLARAKTRKLSTL